MYTPIYSSLNFNPSSQKSDSLAKLYEMDDNPDRRGWLDKLLSFMEERRTPISACPTISKQALDLYKLYCLVKDRGGFVEVCKVSLSYSRNMFVSFPTNSIRSLNVMIKNK